jgi:hypothetical protein
MHALVLCNDVQKASVVHSGTRSQHPQERLQLRAPELRALASTGLGLLITRLHAAAPSTTPAMIPRHHDAAHRGETHRAPQPTHYLARTPTERHMHNELQLKTSKLQPAHDRTTTAARCRTSRVLTGAIA